VGLHSCKQRLTHEINQISNSPRASCVSRDMVAPAKAVVKLGLLQRMGHCSYVSVIARYTDLQVREATLV
jgi:hypothetical protein